MLVIRRRLADITARSAHSERGDATTINVSIGNFVKTDIVINGH